MVLNAHNLWPVFDLVSCELGCLFMEGDEQNLIILLQLFVDE